jgi:hypothetical protein
VFKDTHACAGWIVSSIRIEEMDLIDARICFVFSSLFFLDPELWNFNFEVILIIIYQSCGGFACYA